MKAEFKYVYFIGVGGIGMSAIARYFLASRKSVFGYDRNSSPLCLQLEKEGVHIVYDESINVLPKEVLDKENTLVVYTPAVSLSQPQLDFFLKNGFEVKKRAEVLGDITKNTKTIGVAGTHGKTTTTSMLAHILKQSSLECAAFVGGITTNYQSNVILEDEINNDTITVVEADEFDRSFLKLFPNLGIITATDADHLDIYGEKDEVKKSFEAYTKLVSDYIVTKKSIGEELGIAPEKLITYGENDADYQAYNIHMNAGKMMFDVQYKGKELFSTLSLQMPGMHNVDNMTAAIAIANQLGVVKEEISSAVNSYKGVKRRFEYVLEDESVTFIDDYAHHPVEIEALLKSVRFMFPEKTVGVIFQPHLYSRTRDFYQEFGQSLNLADELFLLPIYPARELPIEGVSSQMIFDECTLEKKQLIEKNELIEVLSKSSLDVVLTVGAGDIDLLIPDVKNVLISKSVIEK